MLLQLLASPWGPWARGNGGAREETVSTTANGTVLAWMWPQTPNGNYCPSAREPATPVRHDHCPVSVSPHGCVAWAQCRSPAPAAGGVGPSPVSPGNSHVPGGTGTGSTVGTGSRAEGGGSRPLSPAGRRRPSGNGVRPRARPTVTGGSPYPVPGRLRELLSGPRGPELQVGLDLLEELAHCAGTGIGTGTGATASSPRFRPARGTASGRGEPVTPGPSVALGSRHSMASAVLQAARKRGLRRRRGCGGERGRDPPGPQARTPWTPSLHLWTPMDSRPAPTDPPRPQTCTQRPPWLQGLPPWTPGLHSWSPTDHTAPRPASTAPALQPQNRPLVPPGGTSSPSLSR